MRKRIETVFSQITRIFPRSIHAVTSKGFEIKVFNFILSYTFDILFKESFALVVAQKWLAIFLQTALT